MSTARHHERKAVALLNQASTFDWEHRTVDRERRTALLTEAQVHASLAVLAELRTIRPKVPTATIDDAPEGWNGDQASTWVQGYNACREILLQADGGRT